jgi:hypothetical protein
MPNISTLSIADLANAGDQVHNAAARSSTMEQCAQEVVRFLYQNFVDESNGRALGLVRCFKTQALGELPFDIRRSISDVESLSANTKCLTLLATAGDEPAWNSRQQSATHKAIPLESRNIIARSPMIAQLILQLGLDISDVINPRPEVIINLHEREYNVFHVQSALGSAHIPAQQQFVVPYGIKSVIGFGGVLATGDLFAIIMFAKVEVPREKAELFQSLAVSVKTAFMHFAWGDTFGAGTTKGVASPLA